MTLTGHPEEARRFRAVSKDQGERIRKRIYEMLQLASGAPRISRGNTYKKAYNKLPATWQNLRCTLDNLR